MDAAYDGEEALEYLSTGDYDGVVLDVMMPKMDGITVLTRLRESGNQIQVLMLTAKAEIDDRVLGLGSGANDYLTKPFATKELLARIRAMTRVAALQDGAKLSAGNILLDRATFTLSSPTGSFRLANREFQMLELLMCSPGQSIKSGRLYEKIWKQEEQEEDETVQSSDTGQIAAVDFSMAVRYAKNILKSGKTQGFVGNYRYLVSDDADKVQIVFLDCGRTLSGFWRFLVISVWVATFGLVAVFILIFLFPKRIIRPMSENYEKQKRFITDAGHEIKTPLTIIDADADVLEMELGENEWLADIRNQTRWMTALTNDLIYLSRMEEAKSGMPMIDFPLSDVTEEVAHEALVKEELKRCADEIASVDLSMQTIRDCLKNNFQESESVV